MDEEREIALERLRRAERLLRRARKLYREDPSETNLIALEAAARVTEERIAVVEEWR